MPSALASTILESDITDIELFTRRLQEGQSDQRMSVHICSVDNPGSLSASTYCRFMPHRETESHLSVDADGHLTEQIEFDGQAVVIRYDDIPESDITTVNGIRCTTPLRTVIDLAAELDPAELDDIVQECLGRGLFTVEQAMDRTAEPDVASRRGAHALRAYLVR